MEIFCRWLTHNRRMPLSPHDDRQQPALGLGLDAGGTQTRWALADGRGVLLAQGHAAGFTALQMSSADGAQALAAVLADIARQVQVRVQAHGRVTALCAGLTGFDGDGQAPLSRLFVQAFNVPMQALRLLPDIELACRAAFAPGEGYLVYAGTGSVAAFVDAQEQLHRAGGRGGLIDDGGSGYWIAREALSHIWRAEDEQPGAWRGSVLAREVFDAVGGCEWADTRRWVYGASRGQLGELAVAVAAAADADPAALALLENAGRELARLAQALAHRHGARPVAFGGRVFQLHPVIEQSMRDALPGCVVHAAAGLAPHITAALLAAKGSLT